MISIRSFLQVAVINTLLVADYAAGADPCEVKEYWFEAGIGFYANGYSLTNTEKRARSLYRSMKGEPLTEDEAAATALLAWHFLDGEKASKSIGQVERLMLADHYYAQCREKAIKEGQGCDPHDSPCPN